MSAGAHPSPPAGTEEYQPVFTDQMLEQLSEILARYPTKQAALLPALWLVQRARGWISDRNMAEVAEVLGLTPAYVKGVVTFYTMYHQHPVGRHFVGKWTVIEVECLGACGFATPVLVDDDFVESVTPDKVPELVRKYK